MFVFRANGLWIAVCLLVVLAPMASGGGAAPATPRPGGTLTVAVEADLRESDHLQARISVDKLIMGSTVYDPLFQSDEKGNWKPALVSEATVSSGGLVWVLKLRSGIRFHNGKPFSAKDVKDNLEAFLDPKNASNLAGDVANIKVVEVVDPLTVQITLKEVDYSFPATLTDTIFMADMDSRRSMGLDAWKLGPIGTGPYKWTARVPGDHVAFERFDGHWRGRPPLDRVIFKVIPDPQVAALALQRNEVDVVPNYISINALPSLRNNANVQVLGIDGNTWYLGFLNFEKARRGGYKDALAFRKGLAYLFNAKEIVPKIIGEFGTYAPQPIPSWQDGHDPGLQPYPYDLARGRELLARAGYPASTLKFLVFQRPFNCDWATAEKSLFEQNGYKVDLQCIRPEAAVGAIRRYDWDVLFARTSGRATAGVFLKDRWRLSLAAIPDDFYTMRNLKLEGLIKQALATQDRQKYIALVQQASRVIVLEQFAAIGGYWDKSWWAAGKRVQNLKLSPLVWYGFLMNAMTTVWVSQ